MWKQCALVMMMGVSSVCGAPLFFTGTQPVLGSGTTPGSSTPIFNCCGVTFSAAAGFTVASGTAYTLDNVQVLLVSDGNSASALSAHLYKDSGGNPSGAAVADLSTTICPCPNGVSQIYTLTPGSSYTLDPSTTYWLVLTSTPADDRNIGWMGTPDANPYSGVFTYAGARVSNSAALPSTVVTQNLVFAVNGTPQVQSTGAPEPGSLWLIAAGLVLVPRLKRHLAR